MGILLLSILLTGLMVSVTTFFLMKRNNPNPLGWLRFYLIILCVSPILYVASIFVWFQISSSYTKKEFDKTAWLADPDQRFEFKHDLIENDKLIGLSQTEILSMLGGPDDETDSTLVYYIGYAPEYFMRGYPDWLEISLERDRVSGVSITP